MIINIKLVGSQLSVIDPPVIAAESANTVRFRLEADAEWAGLTTTVVFRRVFPIGVDARSVVAAPGTVYPVPPEVLHAGWLYIGAKGVAQNGQIVLTTAKMEHPLRVNESEADAAASSGSITASMADQILALIGEVSNLDTSSKSSLVDAINEVNKKAVKSVNGVQPDEAGDVTVASGGLQIVRAVHGSDDVYTATGDALPPVVPGSNGQHTGKGSQIVFIPGSENSTAAPKLQLNGGSAVQIRMRAPWNQWDNSQSPDATLPVPIGALMNGVPYTMTFCGFYWLIDSHVERYNEQESAYLQKLAESMSFVSDVQGVALPAFEVNGEGTPESVSARKAAVISATDAESAETFLELPTVKKVKEMLTADAAPLYITLSYNTDAAKWFSDVNYTASDIIAALSARQVVVKVIANEHTTLYAPVTQYVSIGSDKRIVFGAISYSDPTDLTMHWFISATCYDSGAWDVVLDDQN